MDVNEDLNADGMSACIYADGEAGVEFGGIYSSTGSQAEKKHMRRGEGNAGEATQKRSQNKAKGIQEKSKKCPEEQKSKEAQNSTRKTHNT